MRANAKDINEIVVSVFEGAAGVELGGFGCGSPIQGDSYSAEVRLSGNWQGTLQVHVSQSLAREVAGTMLHRQHQWLDEASVMDAMGEIANMIAGNLRPLVDGAKKVGIPVVRYHRIEEATGDEALLGCAFSRAGRSLDVKLVSGDKEGRSWKRP
jgi:CheY-specific phosphatase CheX